MATVYKRGRSWVLQWTDRSTGKQRRESLGRVSPREAKARLAAKELEISAGWFTSPPKLITLSEFLPRYLNWHATEYPSSHYRVKQILEQHVKPELGDVPLDEITEERVEQYKARRLATKAAAGTVAKELRTLAAVSARAVRWRAAAENQVRSVAPPQLLDSKPIDFYTAEQLAALYALGTWYTPIWKLLANTGLRRAEAWQLQWGRVETGRIIVVSSTGARTKSAKWREIPVGPGAREALEALYPDRENDMYVLPRMALPSASRAFIREAGKAGIGGSMHWLRHTFISHLVMRGVPLRTVQVLAGHSTITITEKYAHLAPGHLQSATQELNL